MIIKFTARDLELERLAREPQLTYGSARARIQNALVRDGLAEFVQPKEGPSLCQLTKAGRVFMAPPRIDVCNMGKTMCPLHEFIHGGEAEELRQKIEKMVKRLDDGVQYDGDLIKLDLEYILDSVDARDSCAVKRKRKKG